MPRSGVKAVIVDDVAAAERRIVEGVEVDAVESAVSGLVPREIDITIQVRHGAEMVEVAGKSVIMDRNERAQADQIEAAQRLGNPSHVFTATRNMRFESWGRIRMQLRLDKKTAKWAYDAIANDDELVITLGGVLAEHEHRWFRGYAATDKDVQKHAVVMAPALAPAGGDGDDMPE